MFSGSQVVPCGRIDRRTDGLTDRRMDRGTDARTHRRI